MKDEGHEATEKLLKELETQIAEIYKAAYGEIGPTIEQYFAKFAKLDKEFKEQVEAGEITQEQYKNWRLAAIGRGEGLEALRDKLAERMTEANEAAVAYINDSTPGIYSLNRNYGTYTIDRLTGGALTLGDAGKMDVVFNLWDEQTVKRLLTEQPDLMPNYPKAKALKRGIDLEYGKRQITAQVTSSILLGDGIPQMAAKLQARIANMSMSSAIRTARTATTAAQSAGRYDSYRAARDMGIKLKVEWLATLDNRTRHSHAILDKQEKDVDEPFEVDGKKILYPGYPLAVGSLIYNCRCTITAKVDGVDLSDAERRARDPMTGRNVVVPSMSYTEWEEQQKEANPEAWEVFMKKGRNASADRKQFEEYREIFGKKIPSRFADFQELKYNKPNEWEKLKAIKKETKIVKEQREIIKNAPCTTTPKKYTGYFLKPGAKHSQDFFNIGYTQDNPLQLRYDMARQFDMSKAIDILTDDDGKERFRIYMNLGVSEEKRFRTVWIKDTTDGKPRIITAFREDKGNDT